MSDANDPTPPADQKPDEPKPLLWHYFNAKDTETGPGTTRDILCLGCTNRQYDARQERSSLGEILMTKAEYKVFVAETLALYDGLLKQHRRITVLTHPVSLIAMVVRKPTIPEVDKLIHAQGDMTIDASQTEAIFRDDLVQRTLWPAQGTDQMAFIMEEGPAAFGHVFPQRLLELVGADRVASKKVG